MSSTDRFARRQHRIEKGLLSAQVHPRLPYSSIDDGALMINDINGDTVGIFGQQWDGSYTAASVGGTTPVAPTVPLATPAVGGLTLYWDGTYVDDSPTRMDFRRVTFHAVTDVDDLDVLSPAQVMGEITIATGGEVYCLLPPVEHFIFAVTWTDSGKFSVESDPAFATPLPVVDPVMWAEHEAALADLDALNLNQVVADLDAAEAAVATLNTVTVPGLESDISAAQIAAIESGSSNTNATFSNWTGAYPDGWQAWSSSVGAITKNVATFKTGGTSVEMVTGVSNTGIQESTTLDPLPLGIEYITVTLDVMLVAGASFDGAGVLLDWSGMTPLTRAFLYLKDEIPNPVNGKWYRVSAVLERPAGSTGTQTSWNSYLMGNYSELGALTSKTVIFDQISYRPSTVPEIMALEAVTRTRDWTATGETTIDGGKIKADSVLAAQIGANAVTANEIAAGAVAADKIAANSIGASKMFVGDLTNLVADGSLRNPDLGANWNTTGLTRVGPVGTTPAYMEWSATSSGNAHRYNSHQFPTVLGDEFYFTCEVSTPATNTANVSVKGAVQVSDASGTAVGWPGLSLVSLAPNTDWTAHSGVITVTQANAAHGVFDPYAIAASGTQVVRMRNMVLRRRAAGSLIVDGAITATKIATEAITADKVAASAITAEKLDVEVLRAGFTLTGRVQVGSSYWTPAEGLVIPQANGGRIQLPADGVTPARFDGHVNAKSATIEKDLNIMGATNRISGQVTLASGITEPTVAPSVFQSWTGVTSADLDGSGAPWQVYTGMTTMHGDATKFVACVQFGGTYLRAFSRTTGLYAASVLDTNNGWQANYNAWGGAAYTNSHYFTLGQDGNRGDAWYVYKIAATTGAKVAEYLVPDTYGKKPAIAADTNLNRLHLLWCDASGNGYDRVLNENLGAVSGPTLYNGYGVPVSHDAAWIGTGDFGAQRLLVACPETSTVISFTFPGLIYQGTESFAYPQATPVRGVWYDSTSARFRSYDKYGKLFTLSSWKTPQSFTSSYTWYDGVGTVRETREGPATTYTLPARSHLNVETPTPPDSGNTDAAQVDKANRVGIYVGVGAASRRLQSYLGVDGSGVSTRLLTMDTVNTVSAFTPASNTFVGGTTSTGKIVSGATGSGQPLLEISGDGSLKVNTITLAEGINGQYISDSGWLNLSFGSGFSDYGGGMETCQFRKRNGVVFIRGLATSAARTGGSIIGTLPVGYRPGGATSHITVPMNGAFGIINLQPSNGQIQFNAGPTSGWLSLANISFIAEN